jgi:hypothetical protein
MKWSSYIKNPLFSICKGTKKLGWGDSVSFGKLLDTAFHMITCLTDSLSRKFPSFSRYLKLLPIARFAKDIWHVNSTINFSPLLWLIPTYAYSRFTEADVSGKQKDTNDCNNISVGAWTKSVYPVWPFSQEFLIPFEKVSPHLKCNGIQPKFPRRLTPQ